ncbi:hypothetical protein RJZ56_002423 [Blastomyces dermatitidis]
MKRPARLRPSVAGHSSTSSSSSMLSRVPLLHVHVHDLSLPAWDVGDQIPGLRIPLAFLSSLRTNLQISSLNEDLLPPSPLIPVTYTPDPLNPFTHPLAETKRTSLSRSALNGTPYLPRNTPLHHENSSTFKKTTPSNPSTTTTATILLQNLTTSTATTADEIHTALHLIADTVSQQRHLAAKCILSHPSILATSLMLFLTIAKLLYTGSPPSDLILMLTLWSLCSLLTLLAIQYMVRGYSALAEDVGTRAWLAASSVNGVSQRRDEVLVARCAGEIVGVLVLRIAKTKSVPAPISSTSTTTSTTTGAGAGGSVCGVDATTTNNASMGAAGFLLPRPRSSRRKSSARWTGIIRAWSVKESHRQCGVGTRLLEEAVGLCRLRNLDGPVFADDHANATQVLPGMFHGKFLEHDRWARRFLEGIILEERGW